LDRDTNQHINAVLLSQGLAKLEKFRPKNDQLKQKLDLLKKEEDKARQQHVSDSVFLIYLHSIAFHLAIR
jgi:hypothetical protein